MSQKSHTHVSVVCRSNYNRVNDAGFSLRTAAWGNGSFKPGQVYSADLLTRSPPKQRLDYIVCAHKVMTDYASTIRELEPLVQPNTTLVSTQNGMDVEEPLRQAFPQNTILTAICNIGCSQLSPGYIEQTAGIKPHAFHIGVYGESTHGKLVDGCRRDTLAAMDPQFKGTECVRKERWQKLIFNSAWNSTTALSGLDTHQLLQRPGAIETVSQLASEAYRVALGSGVELEEDSPAKVISLVKGSPPITPSTLQDARHRRPMEIAPVFGVSPYRAPQGHRATFANPLTGYLVSQAAKVGVHVPCMNMVYVLLQQMNERFLSEVYRHGMSSHVSFGLSEKAADG